MRPPALTEGDALFLDFDGTLAPIADDPDAVFLSAEVDAALARAVERLGGAVAIISGRDLRDLARRTPQALLRIGGHGLERAASGAEPGPRPAPPADLARALADAVAGLDGVRVEEKGRIFAVHYRGAPDQEASVRRAATGLAQTFPGYVAQHGKMVSELKPCEAHKGRALAAALARPPFAGRRPVMAGDDATDEDAFEAAAEAGGYGVKIGEGATRAAARLPDTAALVAWINESLGINESLA